MTTSERAPAEGRHEWVRGYLAAPDARTRAAYGFAAVLDEFRDGTGVPIDVVLDLARRAGTQPADRGHTAVLAAVQAVLDGDPALAERLAAGCDLHVLDRAEWVGRIDELREVLRLGGRPEYDAELDHLCALVVTCYD